MAFDVIRWDGEKIAKPGLYSGIPMDAYHGDLCVGPSISSGGLRTIFNQSPAHYYDESYLNPDREEREDNAALILGRATHHLLLGESDFAKHFVIRPDELNGKAWNSNRTDCKEWLAAVAAEHLTVLKGEQVTAIRGMSKSLSANPMINHGILNGLIEHSLVWQDEETGIWLKSRPDAIPTDSADFSDLKTAYDVSDDGITRAIGGNGYHMQAGLIGMASRAVLKMAMQTFTLVFVEKARPHCVRVVTLKPADLALGERQIRAALRIFKRCVETGSWPGPGGHQKDAVYVELREWDRKAAEYRLTQYEAEEEIEA